jgi:hypothetical protein
MKVNNKPQRYRERVLILFIAAVLLLNYPLLSLADRPWLVLGIPLLYFYLFLIWLLLIVALALLTRFVMYQSADDD